MLGVQAGRLHLWLGYVACIALTHPNPPDKGQSLRFNILPAPPNFQTPL